MNVSSATTPARSTEFGSPALLYSGFRDANGRGQTHPPYASATEMQQIKIYVSPPMTSVNWLTARVRGALHDTEPPDDCDGMIEAHRGQPRIWRGGMLRDAQAASTEMAGFTAAGVCKK